MFYVVQFNVVSLQFRFSPLMFTNNQNVGTSGEFSLNMEALFSPWVFLLAFVFCVVINLLSAALPAWIAARHTIVDSLNDK